MLSVFFIIAIAFATSLVANRGELRYLAEYQAENLALPTSARDTTPTMPSPSPAPSQSPLNPLTGLPAGDKADRNRPYAVMINNIGVSQPQLGVSKADIIYEIRVEGGITRMMAIFQDITDAGEIGSIRSARPYFVDIANGYDAVYIHAGGSPDAYAALKSIGITSLDGVNGGKQDIFYRDPVRRKKMGYEHSLVTTSALIAKYLPTYGFRLTHDADYTGAINFGSRAIPASDATASNAAALDAAALPAGHITVQFSNSKSTTFDYSAESALYTVSQYGKAYIDGNSEVPITASNLLILKTDINIVAGDTAGRIDVAVTGNGKGYYICRGGCEAITWSRDSSKDLFSYHLEDGSPLVLVRGKTYVCVIDRSNTVEIT